MIFCSEHIVGINQHFTLSLDSPHACVGRDVWPERPKILPPRFKYVCTAVSSCRVPSMGREGRGCSVLLLHHGTTHGNPPSNFLSCTIVPSAWCWLTYIDPRCRTDRHTSKLEPILPLRRRSERHLPKRRPGSPRSSLTTSERPASRSDLAQLCSA